MASHLPPRTVVFGVTSSGDFIGVRTLSDNFVASELEIVTEWFRELKARFPVHYASQHPVPSRYNDQLSWARE
jgi:hypothetical protein